MLFFKRMKLSHQLALMVVLTVLVIIAMQSVYHIRYNIISQDKARVYVDNLMNQVEEKLDTTARDIEKASMTISYDENIQKFLTADIPIERMQLYNSIQNSLSYIISTSSTISNILLVDNRNKTFILNSTNNYDLLSDLAVKYNFSGRDFTDTIYTSAFPESNNSETYIYAYIAPIFSIAEDAKPRTKIGTCIILNRIDDFQNTIKRISLSENSLFLIKDSEGRIISSNRTELIGTFYSDWESNTQNGVLKNVSMSGGKPDSIIQMRDVESLNFQLISILPVEEVTGDISSLRNFGVVTAAAMAIVMMFISILFFRSIMSPVAKIAAFLESLNQGHLHKRLHMPQANEIGSLAENINSMLARIDEMTRKIVNTQSSLYEMALSKKQAELSALQSQINPHFLYNTLNCIQSMGLVCGSMDIVNISAALVRIFRYSIKGGEIVKIRDEVECIKDYLKIMSIRYNGKFIAEINIDESILEMKTLKMVLQPIVENAIYHGLECKKGKGILKVSGQMENQGTICFEVYDNGLGIDEGTLSYINRRLKNWERTEENSEPAASIGLYNINKRIKLYFGDEYGIELTSREDEGTRVRIRLPVKKWEDDCEESHEQRRNGI